jgi:predicted small lipoprotein YifL
MKKTLIIFLSLVLMLTFAACGEKNGGKSPSESSAPAESGKSQSVDGEMAKLKELYDGKWINEDPHDSPFTILYPLTFASHYIINLETNPL